MKRAERQPWIDIGGYILCCWCRHAEWATEDVWCMHPLEAVRGVLDNSGIEPGDDCWGFRPTRGWTPELARGRVMDRLEGRDDERSLH